MKHNKLKAGVHYIAYAPNGEEILGTYEKMTARSEIAFFTKGTIDHGVDYEHAGGSEIFWDGMETVTRTGDDGESYIVYLCAAGEEWTINQLDFKRSDA
jgi:hypothetical protein